MASDDQDSHRKHHRSYSPGNDVEKSSSSKRHKHRHHHRYHCHRHNSKMREEEEEIKAAPEDDVEAPPPSSPVAVAPSDEDVEEGEICSDGGLDDGVLETKVEFGEIVAFGTREDSDKRNLIGSPVDFELPDWFKKWKPINYTFIKRNIYLTKRIKRRLKDDGIFCACSSSPGSSSVCG